VSSLSFEQQQLIRAASKARVSQDYTSALQLAEQITRMPDSSEIGLFESALIYFETQRYQKAIDLLIPLIGKNYKPQQTHLILAECLKHDRRFSLAIEHYIAAQKLGSVTPYVYLSLSFCHMQLGQIEQALSFANDALSLQPDYLAAKEQLAQLHSLNSNFSVATKLYLELLEALPDSPVPLYSLATIYKNSGELTRAKEYYEQAIAKDAQFTPAYFGLSSVHKYAGIDDPHLTSLLKVSNSPTLSQADSTLVHFALAKAYEDVKEFELAFTHLSKGNTQKFNSYGYDVRTDLLLMENIKQVFNQEVFSQNKLDKGNKNRAIFILGMPRSGTSLVEKILASHSKVYAGGELDTFFRLGSSLFRDSGADFHFSNISSYSKEELDQIRTEYLDKLKDIEPTGLYVTDKLPVNFLMVGLIKLLIPNALIIHCKRNSLDTCLSIYKSNFSNDNYRFAYDLLALGEYYKGYESLMEHWSSMFKDEIIEVEYEQLAKSPATEIPHLLQRCGLTIEDNCLHFHNTPGIVKTASAVQVRKPMYTSSIGFWQNYATQLQPLIDSLNTKL